MELLSGGAGERESAARGAKAAEAGAADTGAAGAKAGSSKDAVSNSATSRVPAIFCCNRGKGVIRLSFIVYVYLPHHWPAGTGILTRSVLVLPFSVILASVYTVPSLPTAIELT